RHHRTILGRIGVGCRKRFYLGRLCGRPSAILRQQGASANPSFASNAHLLRTPRQATELCPSARRSGTVHGNVSRINRVREILPDLPKPATSDAKLGLTILT